MYIPTEKHSIYFYPLERKIFLPREPDFSAEGTFVSPQAGKRGKLLTGKNKKPPVKACL